MVDSVSIFGTLELVVVHSVSVFGTLELAVANSAWLFGLTTRQLVVVPAIGNSPGPYMCRYLCVILLFCCYLCDLNGCHVCNASFRIS